jgi:hypothetical protein
VAVFYVEALNYTFNVNLKELNIKITINKFKKRAAAVATHVRLISLVDRARLFAPLVCEHPFLEIIHAHELHLQASRRLRIY